MSPYSDPISAGSERNTTTMHSKLVIVCAAFFSFLATSANPLEFRQDSTDVVTCNNVHIIGIRGTGKECNPKPGYGEQNLGGLIKDLRDHIPHSDDMALDYPACGSGEYTYSQSEEQGRLNLIEKIKQYVTKYNQACKNSKARIVLVGYSQGAQVVADTICGNSDTNKTLLGDTFFPSDPIDTSFGQYIVAAAMFADPSFDPRQPWRAGTCPKDDQGGTFIRTKPMKCQPYYDRAMSWCDKGDRFCDSGLDLDLTIHHSYFDNQTHYIEPARKFIQGLV